MNDTIVALSTPPGIGAVHIVRMSGRGSFSITRRIIGAEIPPHRKLRLYDIYDADGDIMDRALVAVFKAPHSYTGEDMVEFHIHGNPVIASALISHIISLGARMAEPGEFTKRALLSGKMTLSQVEALHEVIYGSNIEAIKAATKAAMGSHIEEIERIYEDLLSVASAMKVDVDYPEDVELEDYGYASRKDDFLHSLHAIYERIEILRKRITTGQKLTQGYKVVLVGAPNVGKSSLLNVIVGYERAIVSDIPGTTRDFIETIHMIGHVPVSLVDVAGIRRTTDAIESVGVEKAKKLASEADFLIWVIDGTRKLTPDDMEIWDLFKDKISVIAVSKVDAIDEEEKDRWLSRLKEFGKKIVFVSAKEKMGVDDLINYVSDVLSSYDYEPLYLSGRVLSLVNEAENLIEEAIYLVETDMPEIASINIERAAGKVGAILGRADVSEDILDRLFSTFCVGK